MKGKRIISIILTLCMMLSMMVALNVTASAETVREVIYETTTYDDGTSAGGDGTALVFFKGDLPGTNGEKYIITYEGKAYTNQPGMNFRLYYGDTFVNAYQKDEWKESYNNGVAINRGNENPYNFKSVVEVDFGKEIPEAAIKVYDHDLTTVLVDTVMQLEGWTGLIKIGVKNWSINGSQHYERPINPKLTVEQVVPAGEEPDEPEVPSEGEETTTEVIYETTTYDDGTSAGGDGTALVFFKGDLPGTNGEKYIITYEGQAHTNQPGMNFRLYYGDTYVNAYQKDEWKESYNNGVAINRGDETPYNFKSVIEVDFSKEIPEAAIKVYDHDLTTVLVDTVMQLEGWTGLIKIGVKNWSINGSEHYERPINPKLTVEQVVPAGEEPDEPEETTVVYETTSYDDGTSAGGDGTALVFFKGDLPGTNGEKYIITYEGKAHTNQPGMNFRLYYGDTYVNAYQKDEWKESYNNGVAINRGGETPYNFKSVIEVDFSKEIPEAAIKVYDHDLTTVLVDTVKQLEGWTGLIKIGVKNWSINGSEHYERPINPKLTVEKVGAPDPVDTTVLNGATISDDEIIVDMEIVAADNDIPYAIIAGFYNGNELIYCDYESSSVEIGDSKLEHTFEIPSYISGNYTNVYIYLWDGLDTLKAYTSPVVAN